MALSSKPFDDPAAEASQFLIRLGLAVLTIAAPLAALVSRRAIFLLFPLGCGVILVGALLAPRRDAAQRMRAASFTRMGLFALVLLGWAALSLVWTPFREEAAERVLKVAGTLALAVAAGAVLPDRTRVANLYLMPVGVVAAAIGAIALGLIGQSEGVAAAVETTVVERAVAILALMMWPALGALMSRQRWSFAVVMPVLVGLAIVAADAPLVLIAVAAGAIAFAAALSDAPRTARILGAAFAALLLFAPLIPFAARLMVGGKTANLVGELAPMADWLAIIRADGLRMFTGHGLDSAARSIAAGYLPQNAPRSALFDIWYELGIVGAAAGAALIHGTFRVAARAHANAAPALIGGVVTGLVIAAAGIGTAQIAWLTIVAAAGVAFVAMVNGLYRTTRPISPSQSVAAPRRPAAG
ncbi:MAG: peptide ABC transporter permease [Methylobacteriaceae bacterium]|nr:peptide ABC transporter permease [Methylobacteriaceae bacterium]